MDRDQRIISNRRRQTTLNIISGILSLVVSSCTSFFLTPFLVREVGVEASGFANLANNFVTYASLLSLAINSMGSRFLSIAFYKNDLEECKKYYSSLFAANLVIVLVLVVPAFLMVVHIDRLLNVAEANVLPAKIVFAVSFGNFFLGLFNSCLSMPLLVLNRNSIINLVSIANSIFKACFLMVVLLVLPAQIYWTAIAGLVFSALSLPLYFVLKRKLFGNVPFSFRSFSPKHVFDLVKSGIWNAINQCGAILLSGLDLLLTNVFISGTEMGILSVAKTIPLVIISLSTTVNSNYSSKLVISYSADTSEEFEKAVEDSCRVSCHLVSVPIAVFCAFSFSFFNIWQPSIDPVKLSILAIMTIGYYIPFTGTTPLFNVLTAKNKLSFNAITYLITALLSFVVTFLLVRFSSLGVFAIALTSTVFSVIRSLFLIIPYYARIMDKPSLYYFKFVGLSLLAFGLSLFISSVFLTVLTPTTWKSMIIAVLLSALVSYGVNFFVLYNTSMKKKVFERLKKLWTR